MFSSFLIFSVFFENPSKVGNKRYWRFDESRENPQDSKTETSSLFSATRLAKIWFKEWWEIVFSISQGEFKKVGHSSLLDKSINLRGAGCSCSMAVEHTARNLVVMGLNPASWWSFFFFFPSFPTFLHQVMSISMLTHRNYTISKRSLEMQPHRLP